MYNFSFHCVSAILFRSVRFSRTFESYRIAWTTTTAMCIEKRKNREWMASRAMHCQNDNKLKMNRHRSCCTFTYCKWHSVVCNFSTGKTFSFRFFFSSVASHFTQKEPKREITDALSQAKNYLNNWIGTQIFRLSHSFSIAFAALFILL